MKYYGTLVRYGVLKEGSVTMAFGRNYMEGPTNIKHIEMFHPKQNRTIIGKA
jgi:hypothetical protein